MQRDRWFHVALLAYGLLNATLYTGLLPLWEGFDEPFHYGYVQHLREHRLFPRLADTTLSSEVWASIQLAPASHIVHRNIPQTIPFGEYFAKSGDERRQLRERLYGLDPALASARSDAQNYEAHQAPLAYVLLAPFDALWQHLPLADRICRLRLVCAWAAVLLTWIGVRTLVVTPVWSALALFLVFSLQMFYASTAHLCNDWLAIPLFTLFLAAAARGRVAACLGFLSGGLLAKAYFLTLVPVVLAVLWRQRRTVRIWMLASLLLPAAWYGRNLMLYGSVSGMQEARGGLPISSLIDAARRVPWPTTIATSTHAALWAGNNSDISFHRRTIDGLALALLSGLVLFLVRRLRSVDWVVPAAVLLHLAGLAFATVQSFWYTSGQQVAPSPWFIQPVYAAVVCLAVSGWSAAGRLGRALAAAAIWLWSYVICATYWLKLIPLYAGYPSAQAQPARLFRWYTGEFPAALDTTALMGSGTVLLLAALVVVTTLGLAGWLTRRVIADRSPSAS
jgi:hypothetical protein